MNSIDDTLVARVVHVLSIVHWIGGVAFVTLVALPLARASKDASSGWALFERIEHVFSFQVKISLVLAGLSGLWMTHRLDLWYRFTTPGFWWMDAMAALWALFMVIVFVVEPLAHAQIADLAARHPGALLVRLARAHFVLLGLAGITIVGAVVGSHGGL